MRKLSGRLLPVSRNADVSAEGEQLREKIFEIRALPTIIRTTKLRTQMQTMKLLHSASPCVVQTSLGPVRKIIVPKLSACTTRFSVAAPLSSRWGG